MWLKLWKMSSLLLFVNIQSLLMARRWNRLWDNSLQFNRGKKAAIMQKCKYEYLHIVWAICALLASIMTLVFRQLWNDIRTILICWRTLWDQWRMIWPQNSINSVCTIGPSCPGACHLQGESSSHQTLQIFITTHSSGTFYRPQTSADKTSPILVNSHMFVVTWAGSELIFLAFLSSFLWLYVVTVSLRPIIFPAVI